MAAPSGFEKPICKKKMSAQPHHVALANGPIPSPSPQHFQFSRWWRNLAYNFKSTLDKSPFQSTGDFYNLLKLATEVKFPHLRINFQTYDSFPSMTVHINAPAQSQDGGSGILNTGSTIAGRIGFPSGGRGPAFIGHVFTLYDASGSNLVSTRPTHVVNSSKRSQKMPSFLRKITIWIKKLIQKEMEEPRIHFFFSNTEAASYMRKVNLHCVDCKVGLYPLAGAYQHFKELDMCKFIPDPKQVRLAKQILRNDCQGRRVKRLKGVPVFTVKNITLAMATPDGVRWFTPYFFDKRSLDVFIKNSVDYYFRWQILSRRSQRHQKMVKDEFPREVFEEHEEGLLDPPEVADFLDDVGQGGVSLDSLLFKAAQIQMQDWLDEVVLGRKWSRKLVGVEPVFTISIDSFEKRAAASQNKILEGMKRRMRTEIHPSNLKEHPIQSKYDGQKVGLGYRDHSKEKEMSSADWGFRAKDNAETKSATEQVASRNESKKVSGQRLINQKKDEQTDKQDEFLGMLSSTDLIGMNETVARRTLASRAEDIRDRIRKGEGKLEMRDPLFIADMTFGFDINGYPYCPVSKNCKV